MIRKYIIITANNKQEANTRLLKYGSETFSVPLSINGVEPISHYGCYWRLTDFELQNIQELLGDIEHEIRDDLNGYFLIG